MPIISILMTAYNRENFISEAIESILSSTFSDFELIIVDDCSTDRTVEIARSFEENDHRVKVFINETNLGDYPNRNKAASYAQGKYLKYIDADDMVYPYGIEYIVKYMESFPEADWGLSDVNQDDHKIFPYLVTDLEIYTAHYFKLLIIFSKAPSSLIIKRLFFESTGGFIEFNGVSDTEYFYRLGLKSNLLLMPHIMWCRGETNGSQSSIHYRNFALHVLYDEIEAFYLEKTALQNPKFEYQKIANKKRRAKNYIKLLIRGPKTVKSYFKLKSLMMTKINSKLNF